MANEMKTTGTGAAHPEFDEWWKAHKQEFFDGATAASCAHVAYKAGQLQAKANKLSASEALFGFVSWITTRDREVVAGYRRFAGPWADLVQRFCDENKLDALRSNWTDYLTPPKDD